MIIFNIRLVLSILIIAVFISCKSDNVDAGAKGKVEYGEGSCAPPVDYSMWNYQNYEGTLYFIPQSIADTVGTGSNAYEYSFSAEVEAGEYSIALEPDVYYVKISGGYFVSPSYPSKITVNLNEMLEQDFKFNRCTSY